MHDYVLNFKPFRQKTKEIQPYKVSANQIAARAHAHAFVKYFIYYAVDLRNVGLCPKFQKIMTRNKKVIETLVSANQSKAHVHARDILLF